MPTGEPNNSLKNRLDQLPDIPAGFEFHSERVWQKMETTLCPEKRNKKVVWLAIAASIFGLLVLLTVISNKKKTPSILYTKHLTEIQKRQTAKPDPKPVNYTKRNETSIAAKSNIKGLETNKSHEDEIKKEGLRIKGTSTVPETFAEIDLPVSMPGDTTGIQKTEITIAKPVTKAKPKFKIAHINELNVSESLAPVQKPVKDNIVFSFKMHTTPAYQEQPIDDEIIIPKKQKTFLSLISSSQ